jgi:uroporphyrin-III C-methyltransferase
MGGREAIITSQKLLEQGRSPDLPVVIVENCSRDNQRILRMTLRELEQGLGNCEGPVLVMIGDALAERSTAKVDR